MNPYQAQAEGNSWSPIDPIFSALLSRTLPEDLPWLLSVIEPLERNRGLLRLEVPPFSAVIKLMLQGMPQSQAEVQVVSEITNRQKQRDLEMYKSYSESAHKIAMIQAGVHDSTSPLRSIGSAGDALERAITDEDIIRWTR